MRIRRFLVLCLPLLGMMKKCEKEPAPAFTLPPLTQAGTNTIGFMIDGRAWRNYGWLPHSASEDRNLTSAYFYSGSYPAFRLSAGQSARNVYELFYVDMDSLLRAGTYPGSAAPVAGKNPPTFRSLQFIDMLTNAAYSSEVAGSRATIVITRLDTAQRIVAGTFSGKLGQVNDPTKQVNITDGRFDVQYRKQ
jgi:hypothetical protein